ncbi:MAG: C25 family cysteine peptidase [candidate division WOR-3 bacterium]
MRKQKGKYRAGIYLFTIFSLVFGVGPSFGGRNPEGQISVSSLIPDSLIQSALGEKNCPPWADFKESLRRLGFDFNEAGGDFDLPSLTFVVSLEKPVKVQIMERERTIPIKCPRVENNYPALIEKEKEWTGEEKEKKASRPLSEHWLITDTSFLAKEKVGKLKVYPFTVDPNSNYLLYQPYRFEFSPPKADLPAASGKAIRQEDPERNFFSRFPIWFKIKIDSTGLYKITGKELKRAGLNLSSVLPEGFKLYNIGEFLPPVSYPDTMVEIPIYVYTGQDGRFDPDDYILFYGEGVSRWEEKRRSYYQDIFSLYNYYWLTYSSEPGKRISTVSPPLTGQRLPLLCRVHMEKELLCPPRGGTLWLWDLISLRRGETKTSKSFSFSFPEAETLIGLSFRVFSAERNWLVRTFANDSFLDSSFVSSAGTPAGRIISITRPLPLIDGKCVASIEISAGGDRDLDVFIDWFEFDLSLKNKISPPKGGLEVFSPERADFVFLSKEDFFLLDISEPLAPKFLRFEREGDSISFSSLEESTAVLICPISQTRSVLGIEEKSDLSLSPLPYLSADFLIVAPKEFRRLANLFADYRQKSSGLSVGYALLEDIYDLYLFGIEEPYALKRFFQRKQPRYALLLGDGNYDYRGILTGAKPGIPPYEFGTGFSYEVYERYPLALDCWYADFEDDAHPLYPDFILGRIPCRSEKEGMEYLRKVANYEKKIEPYRLRFLFSADDEYLGDPYTPDNCGLGVHIRSCEYLERFLPNFFEIKKVYLTEYPLSSVKDKPGARKQFSDELSDGALGVIYFGHGAGFRLAHEQLLNIEDVFKIKTNAQYPFGFFGSCGVGRFDDFELGRYREAIAEDLIRNPDGFIATIACTKASSPGTNERLCEVLLSSLFSSRRADGLGEAFFRAQVHDISYHLFGDPLIKISFPPEADWLILRKDTLRPKKVCSFSGTFNPPKADSPPLTERIFSSRIFYGKRFRKYTSTVYYNNSPYIFRIDYTLPGFRVGGQKDRQAGSSFQINFIPPAGLPLDTVGDINNFYLELPNTAEIISFVSGQDSSYVLRWDSIVRDTTSGDLVDGEGPLLRLFAEGRELKDTAYLPKTFFLSGEMVDQSGIFTSSYRYYPRLFLNDQEFDLSPLLREDYHPSRLRFNLSLSLSSETTNLRILSYDNFLNPAEKRVKITTLLSPRLSISEPLAYYRKNSLTFTFTLSYPALLEVKIWTLAGRFIKSFSQVCPSGRNTFSFPLALPKGVYLYKLSANSLSLNQKAEVYEKLLVH